MRGVRRPFTVANWFYVAVSVLVASILVVAFWPNYLAPLLRGNIDKPSFIHLHAAIFFGFVLLFMGQTLLAATERIDLHRRLGSIGAAYGLVIVVVGVFTAFSQISGAVIAGRTSEARAGLLTPLMDMLVFAVFFGSAIGCRRRPEVHKRLMLVAITILLDSSASRIDIPYRQLIWVSPIVLGVAYDFVARRLLHPVYVIGLATICLMLQRQFVVQTDTWNSFSDWLIAIAFAPAA